ncbi:hypothetical protein EMIHUDRAFT_249120 [Emiliania huxleyi CCMP1516]|uniref:CW-type domain-containing protein n=2 Tax=Emiliania huxleyi TaxID=2903 RepID=A0A0D3IAM6_EMIH1|nr:hypothetical protein EMIHUDRAFT_249120 [Emiliania huxleyi CCMP1516]EOD08311.1 hypothetical protein EMIHUDRAFT_249120 [Emiliania huxleyi CCMP1516]|eukprot:XP_005760740.1 hypothetical protein EMIHUDRAFT_249120 [Emiliania huxleyi CCMP1516]
MHTAEQQEQPQHAPFDGTNPVDNSSKPRDDSLPAAPDGTVSVQVTRKQPAGTGRPVPLSPNGAKEATPPQKPPEAAAPAKLLALVGTPKNEIEQRVLEKIQLEMTPTAVRALLALGVQTREHVKLSNLVTTTSEDTAACWFCLAAATHEKFCLLPPVLQPMAPSAPLATPSNTCGKLVGVVGNYGPLRNGQSETHLTFDDAGNCKSTSMRLLQKLMTDLFKRSGAASGLEEGAMLPLLGTLVHFLFDIFPALASVNVGGGKRASSDKLCADAIDKLYPQIFAFLTAYFTDKRKLGFDTVLIAFIGGGTDRGIDLVSQAVMAAGMKLDVLECSFKKGRQAGAHPELLKDASALNYRLPHARSLDKIAKGLMRPRVVSLGFTVPQGPGRAELRLLEDSAFSDAEKENIMKTASEKANKGGRNEDLPVGVTRGEGATGKYRAAFSSTRFGRGSLRLSGTLNSLADAEQLAASGRQLVVEMDDFLKDFKQPDAKRVFRSVLAQKEPELMQGTFVRGDETVLPATSKFIQCDGCDVWRWLPPGHVYSDKDRWLCHMHPAEGQAAAPTASLPPSPRPQHEPESGELTWEELQRRRFESRELTWEDLQRMGNRGAKSISSLFDACGLSFTAIQPTRSPDATDDARRDALARHFGMNRPGQCATCGAQLLLKYAHRTMCCRYACLKAAAAKRRARHADGSADDARLGVKRRLDGELASARVNDDDAKEGDTIMVDAAQMAAAAAAGTDRGTKRLLHVALAARDGKHIPDIYPEYDGARCEAQPASAISVPIIGTSRAVCVAFSGESEARAFLEHHAGGGATESDGLIAIRTPSRTRGAINTAAQIEHFTPLLQKHFGNVVSVQEGYHSFLGAKSDENDGSILFKVKNENLACNLLVLPNVYASGDVGGPLRLDVGCVKVLGNKLCPSCRAFGLTNADIIHDAQCAAQALKARRAVAANVAKKKTFQSVIVDNKVEVARAAGKNSARCRYAPCVNFEALLHTAFKDTVYERMPSASNEPSLYEGSDEEF